MLELKNISVRLLENSGPIVENFNFTLNRGDRAVIIGEEGNGKSTLLKLIFDPGLIEDYCAFEGQIIKKGKTAYLPQIITEDFPGQRVFELFSGFGPAELAAVLSSLGLAPDFANSRQTFETLSGGEKVKARLARILLDSPDILLLDEPTNDLDIETLEWLEGYIQSVKLPVLFISHDETLIENTANLIIHMERLVRKTMPRITVSRSGYREYLQARGAAFEKNTQIAKKQRKEYEAQLERWQQIYNRVDHEQKTVSRQDPGGGRLLKKKMKSVLSQKKRFERQAEDFIELPQAEEAILTAFDGDISLPRSKVILDFSLPELKIGDRLLAKDISLFVRGGEHIGIIGKNGSGKSTLLFKIWEALSPRRDIRTCFMPQDYRAALDYEKTPLEHLALRYDKDELTRARSFMGSMKFTRGEMAGKIGALSGGQRAKLLFLDMVLKRGDVLLLDEPTRNFSPLSGPVIRKALSDFRGAIISVSHDRKYLAEVCDGVFELRPGGLYPVRLP